MHRYCCCRGQGNPSGARPGGNVRATGQNWRIDASLLRVVMIRTSPQKDRQVAPRSGRPVEERGIAVK
ncbi:hypothetical protein CGGC5_v012567 [Colletotrichum fructicola Nara gc5]|uniref:Uncharacterized protein n=1 Tax=Colletotrichum fructicola (strain Nara gc5) TaxID=1213859 RepID=A0A7J6IQH9_COLFN|nr:hypothetical protein CGGC5_v012567 [Colletotrichum fructicola Nara gc5]